MVEASAPLNGSGNQAIWIYVARTSQAAWNAGNYSQFYGEVRYYGNGWGSWTNSTQYWSANFGGHAYSGTFTIPQSEANNSYKVLFAGYFNHGHDANGYLGSFYSSASIDTNHSSIGDGSVGVTEGASPRIPRPPYTPPTPTFASAGTTTIDYNFTAPADNGGSGITNYNHQSATDAGFTQNVRNWDDTGSPGQATSLTPGTPHWIRFRAVNALGASGWTSALQATTLPAVPPGLVPTGSPSGTSATLTFTPPGGVTGVRKYDWERRLAGTTTPVASGETATTVAEVGGLTPGATYEWRGSAWIDQYQSPWTNWIPLQQAKPNTNPGDYFDGSTTDTPDLDYAWTGAANNSTSIATASVPSGWGVAPSGGAAIITRVLSDGVGLYVARVVWIADATVAGSRFGQRDVDPYWTDVTENATYVGTIRVKPSRSNRMAAEITWLNAAGAVLSRATGTAGTATAATWNLLKVSGVAPANAKFAALRAIDVAGTGWSAWLGGDLLELDAAMISLTEEFPYFDGDTLDTPEFFYEWEGADNASVSTRRPTNLVASAGAQAEPDPLAGCVVPPAPPRPPSVPSDCIQDIGVWRRYYVEIPSINVSDWLAGVLTLRVLTGAVAAQQVRIRVYPNPFDQSYNEVDLNEWCSEQIVSYLPASTVLTLDGVTQRAWAEVNGGSSQSADHLLYGTGGTPATWPILSCGISYLVSLEVPIDAPEGNVDVEAFVTTRT